MQVVGKLYEHKTGTFDKDGEEIAYDFVLVEDEDVPALPGVELIRAKIKPPKDDARKAGYARLAGTAPGTPVVVTVEQDKFGSLRYAGHDVAK